MIALWFFAAPFIAAILLMTYSFFRRKYNLYKAARMLKGIANAHKDNPELNKEINDLADMAKGIAKDVKFIEEEEDDE